MNRFGLEAARTRVLMLPLPPVYKVTAISGLERLQYQTRDTFIEVWAARGRCHLKHSNECKTPKKISLSMASRSAGLKSEMFRLYVAFPDMMHLTMKDKAGVKIGSRLLVCHRAHNAIARPSIPHRVP